MGKNHESTSSVDMIHLAAPVLLWKVNRINDGSCLYNGAKGFHAK
jgi:hypothetical protein